MPRPRWRELAGKRFTGFINWHRNRHAIHDMAVLERLTVDLLAQRPDHVALTGDLTNLGLAGEFVTARVYAERLGGPGFVSVIPGNHDVYAGESLASMQHQLAPYMAGDDGAAGFPYCRVRGGVALIGVNSGVVTAPFMASGRMGQAQGAELRALLLRTRDEGLARVVMIHHPPHASGARAARGLRDAPALEALLAETGADLVLHGHNHRQSLHWLPAADGPIPVVGVASASAVPGSPAHRAAYHLHRIGREAGRVVVTMAVRGLGDRGEMLTLAPERALRPR